MDGGSSPTELAMRYWEDCKCICLFFVLFFENVYLFERPSERDRESMHFCPLVHSSKCCNSQDWARLKEGGLRKSIRVSLVGVGHPSLVPSGKSLLFSSSFPPWFFHSWISSSSMSLLLICAKCHMRPRGWMDKPVPALDTSIVYSQNFYLHMLIRVSLGNLHRYRFETLHQTYWGKIAERKGQTSIF